MYARNWPTPAYDKQLPRSFLQVNFFKMMTSCIDFYESYLSTIRSDPPKLRVYWIIADPERNTAFKNTFKITLMFQYSLAANKLIKVSTARHPA
jgi:hypothetical protein